MAGEACFEERHHHRHLLRIVISALPVETDKCAAPADRFLDIHVRVYQVAEMPDDDVLRLYAGIFQNIELLQRRFTGNSGMRENRKIRRDMRSSDGPEHLAFL